MSDNKSDGRLPPALKHGAYSATSVLPGEKREDFEKLHQSLITDWAPVGPLEDDVVATMARYLWRKQNLGTLYIAEFAKARYAAIRDKKRACSLDSLLDFRPVETEEDRRAADDEARKELGAAYNYLELGECVTFDGLAKQLEVERRLDALIDGCIKRLLLARGVKSVSAASPLPSQKQIPSPPKAA